MMLINNTFFQKPAFESEFPKIPYRPASIPNINSEMVTTWMPLPTMRSLLFRPSPMYTNWPSDVTVPPILLTRI
jgi:hypothetical protein